ncbi:MAG TPA: DMT family transporter [Ktedonobacterales bacterium]|nr:DMT family transporter [Ktedonobacterales bacterium]
MTTSAPKKGTPLVRVREYGVLGLLALIWGASFLFIKIGVLAVSPATLVELRLLFSVVTLLLVVACQPSLFAGWRRFWKLSLAVGVINYVIPYLLIAWGETRISSGMASILNATTPLFTVLLANWWAAVGYEALTVRRGLGVVVGFLGVGVLVGPGLFDLGGGQHPDLAGLIAVLIAAAAYAVGALLSRGYAGSAQLVGPLGSQLAALIVTLPIALLWSPPTHLPSWLALGAIAELGVLGTGIAYLLYFWLINHVGATRTMVVTYLLPCTALIWGVALLGETVTWYALVGLAFVLVGTLITNGTLTGLFTRRRKGSRGRIAPAALAVPAETVVSEAAELSDTSPLRTQ